VERRDEGQRINLALNSLPSEQRQVIELAYFGGLTHGEIATSLSLPPGTVKGRMRLGLARMRASLGDSSEITV
jgi:RNA polymerase sigma-70 factor (ECF subfamily)